MSREQTKSKKVRKRSAERLSPTLAKSSPERPKFLLSQLWNTKGPLLLYSLKFLLLTGLFYTLLLIPELGHINDHIASFSATTASSLLNLFGEKSQIAAGTIYTNHFAITVAPECAGAELICLFAAAVLIFPVSARRKIIGLFAGALVLSVLNLLRIVSLYLTGKYFPSLFEMLHEQVWGFLFIPATLFLFLGWMHWALNGEYSPPKKEFSA